MLIELAGVEAGSLSLLAQLDGVLEVSGGPGGDQDPGHAPGLTTAVVRQASSDAVLRTPLSWDGVHVASVRDQLATGAGR